jgi:hypothetical protein
MNFLSNSAPSAATTFGSIVHDHIAEPCLVDGTAAICKLGHRVEVDGQSHEITTEMVATCQPYLDYVRSQPGTLLVEFTLPIAHIVDEPGAVGTPDAVLLRDDGFSVIDLKTGNNPRNKILAAGNLQLTIYAMAVADYFGFIGNFEHVQLAIVQPRLQHISETELQISELEAFRAQILPGTTVNPGHKQCRYCANRPTCAEWLEFSARTVADEFDSIY